MLDKDIINCRDTIVGIDTLVKNIYGEDTKYINFDNAATTPPFKNIFDELEKYMNYYASVGRGVGYKSKLSSDLYNKSRQRVKKFFDINDERYTVIYSMNTTQSINILANALVKSKKDIVISTRMEHHSNDLPWRKYATVKYVEVDEKGKLKVEQFEKLCKKYLGKVKVVTVTGASNVTGYINDVHYIAKIAHKYNAVIVVDGAQLVPHKKINILGSCKEEEIDFMVFSAHKMYAPFGTGVIVGKIDRFSEKYPFIPGGGTVDIVGHDRVFWLKAPKKEEGGTPNVAGVLALITAMDDMENIGLDKIELQENLLKDYFTEKIMKIPEVTLYYDPDDKKRVSVCCFNIKGHRHQELAEYLGNKECIGIRTGCFCAQPYVKKLLGIKDSDTFIFASDKSLYTPGMIRVSFAFYNTVEEIDYFIEAVKRFIKITDDKK